MRASLLKKPTRSAPRRTARRRPRWPAVLVAGVLAASVAWVALGLLRADDTIVVQPDVFVTDPGPEGLIDAHNSPAVATNPTDPDNVVVVNRVDQPTYGAVLHVSTDAGRTWSVTALPLPEGTGADVDSPVGRAPDGSPQWIETQRPFAPDVAFAADGSLYVTYVNLMGRGNVPDNLWVARSDDGGRTLSQPVRVAGDLTFQARVAVDDDGAVHVTYLQAEDVGIFALPSPATVVARRSLDGGRTFEDPVRVSDPERLRVVAASPAVDADGELVVVYQDFKGNVRDFQNLEGPAWEEPSALVVTRSTDGGRSFAPGVEVDAGVITTRRFLVFLPEFPGIAASDDGALYVVWADARHGSEDVLLSRSSDAGRSWTAPVRVNDNPSDDGTSQYLPTVATAANGRVDVAYLDRRRDPEDVRTEVSLATSSDGGASFRTVRLSSAAFDATIGPVQGTYSGASLGSRLGLSSQDDAAFVAWTDTRVAADQPDLARQDIVAARAEIPDFAAMAARRRWLAVLGAVLLAGLVVLVRRTVRARRTARSGAEARPRGRR